MSEPLVTTTAPAPTGRERWQGPRREQCARCARPLMGYDRELVLGEGLVCSTCQERQRRAERVMALPALIERCLARLEWGSARMYGEELALLLRREGRGL